MIVKSIADRLHHFGYAIAAVIIAFLVLNFLGNRPTPMREIASVTPKQDSVQRELESLKAAVTTLAISRGNVVMPYQAPAVAVVREIGGLGGFSNAALAAGLSGLGRQPTAQAIHVSLAAPTPGPLKFQAPPDVSSGWALWHHEDARNAALEAINASHINVTVVQEPIAPSRVKTCYLADQSAGLCYAVIRRHQLDYDIGATKGSRGIQPTLGVEYRLKNTSFGLFAGVTVRAGKPAAVGGFAVSF